MKIERKGAPVRYDRYDRRGFSNLGCTIHTEPDDSEVMVSLADVAEAVRKVTNLGYKLDEAVADRLRAGASDEYP